MSKEELSSTELQKIEFEILRYIKKVCELHNINYYLIGGTALGAIRHHGFIPWDDDIDIAMLRDDFEQFCSVMKKNNTDYKLLSLNSDKKYTLPLAKVIDTRTVLHQLHQREKRELGVYVDIFILDNIPESKSIQDKFIKRQVFIARLWEAAQSKDQPEMNHFKAILKTFGRRFLWIIGPRFFARMLDNNAKMFKNIDTKLCGSLVYSTIWGKSIYPKTYFSPGRKERFEKEDFTVPSLVEEYLKNDYGDYMQLPPVEKRVSHHNFVAYYK